MIDHYSKLIEQEITKYKLPANLPGLYDPILYTLNLGGKRLRPLLTLMATKVFHKEAERSMNQAMGLEIFHNFTLVHDDIMDNAPLRRGKESVFKKWNSSTAILSGDVMFALAVEKMAQCEAELLPAVLKTFIDSSIKVCEGQQMDMDFETQEQVGLDAYLQMIQLKTAELLGASLKIGAMIGGASEKAQQDLFNYGMKIGTAFQLMDDYLDVFGDPEKFGKQVGGDILAGKRTFLYLKAIELMPSAEATALKKIYKPETERGGKTVEEVADIFRTYQIDEVLKSEMSKLIEESKGLLNLTEGDANAKNELIHLTDRLTNREK